MNETVGHIVGWSAVGITIVIIVFTIADINKNRDLSPPNRTSWVLFVLVGNLFGVIMYWFFRDKYEEFIRNMTRKR